MKGKQEQRAIRYRLRRRLTSMHNRGQGGSDHKYFSHGILACLPYDAVTSRPDDTGRHCVITLQRHDKDQGAIILYAPLPIQTNLRKGKPDGRLQVSLTCDYLTSDS